MKQGTTHGGKHYFKHKTSESEDSNNDVGHYRGGDYSEDSYDEEEEDDDEVMRDAHLDAKKGGNVKIGGGEGAGNAGGNHSDHEDIEIKIASNSDN